MGVLQNGISGAPVASTHRKHALWLAPALVCAIWQAAPATARTGTLVPASGPGGTKALLTGRGFSRSAKVRLRVGRDRKAAVRTDRHGTFQTSVTIPRSPRASLEVVSGDHGARVRNVFRLERGRPAQGEVSAANGARVRWSPLGARAGSLITLAVRRMPSRRRLQIRFGPVRLAAGATSRRGSAAPRLTVPRLSPGRYAVIVSAGGRALRFSFAVTPPGAGTTPGVAIAPNLVRPAIEDVTAATAYRYTARDDQGMSLDTLKVVPSPGGGYLGVYHVLTGGVFVTKLARSTNLMTWTHTADLAAHASQPTIASLSDGGFLVAFEQDSGCTGTGPGGNCLAFRHYANLASLVAGVADQSFQAPRTLSKCAEGTPNIYSADLHPDIAHSTIDVGFHYFRNCDVDRQARGTLQNFSSWSAHVDAGLNGALEAFGPGGNIGDRDYLALPGAAYNIHEVQFTKGDFGSWRVFLYDWGSGQASPLAIRTHRGSKAFANPTFTSLLSPSGRPALLVTLFIPLQGAGQNEAGELVYYRELPP